MGYEGSDIRGKKGGERWRTGGIERVLSPIPLSSFSLLLRVVGEMKNFDNEYIFLEFENIVFSTDHPLGTGNLSTLREVKHEVLTNKPALSFYQARRK